jgi:hypothetical protein
LKTFEEFEKVMLDFYDEIQVTVERLEEEKGSLAGRDHVRLRQHAR